MVRLALGQSRISPPRSRRNVATDLPAATCEPLTTFIPAPARSAGPWTVVSEANNSPTVGGDCAAAEETSSNTRGAYRFGIFRGNKTQAYDLWFSSHEQSRTWQLRLPHLAPRQSCPPSLPSLCSGRE